MVMATRAEEAVWFPVSYPGARAALGRLPASELDARRVDTGRTLTDHMQAANFSPYAVREGQVSAQTRKMKAFVELHIEQGPRLGARDLPVAVVTAINGGFRFPNAVCLGQYAHSGAEPRFSRADSVLGFAAIVIALDQLWDQLEAEGLDLNITFGRVQSDPAQHGGSRVLGEVGFSLDVRSEHQTTLERVEKALPDLCAEIEARLGVTFRLGERFDWPAVRMDAAVVDALLSAAAGCGLKEAVVPSGAGHDAAVFAEAGIPTAMLFVRSSNGSHNPDEHMALSDFAEGVAVLLAYVRAEDNALV
jgi:N-carbamoyl-L-amino-acid hydrolase